MEHKEKKTQNLKALMSCVTSLRGPYIRVIRDFKEEEKEQKHLENISQKILTFYQNYKFTDPRSS